MPFIPTACFAPANIDACGSWRMFYPKLYVPNSRFIFTEGMPPLDELAESDVVVVQRMMMAGNIKFLQIARQCGLKIIYDLDDDLWNLPDGNPAKMVFRQKAAWQGLEACAEWANVVTVSTKTLAKILRNKWEHIRNVVTKKPIPVMICENRAPLDLYCPLDIKSDKKELIIGWGGSNTHSVDLAQMWPVLHEILDMYPHVVLEMVGHQVAGSLIDHPQVRYREWCHISEFPGRFATWNWDIVMAPLEDNKFNRSKSNIKMQEAGSIHRPCLASMVTPYEEFCSHNEELKWLLCYSPFQWKKKLIELIENPAMRMEIGEKMYANVRDNYNIYKSVPEWKEAINVAFSG